MSQSMTLALTSCHARRRLFVPGIVMTKQMPYFALEIENWAHSPNVHTIPIQVVFDLYHKVLKLKNLYDRFGPR
jgi:hypothetical protein